MTELADWLRQCMEERHLTQTRLAVGAGVAQATLSDVLSKGHIPRVPTLLRLADYFGLDPVDILKLAGHLRTADQLTAEEDDPLVRQLVHEFRRVPDEWKGEAIEGVRRLRRLAGRLPQSQDGFQGREPA